MTAGRVVALAPHLDDAVFSIGGTLAAAARRERQVTVLTVLASDPSSARPAGQWDRRAGFATTCEAARARRAEDSLACRRLGVSPVWLPFPDRESGPRPPDDTVWEAVEPHLRGAETVLLPGFPLAHEDHAWLSQLALERLSPEARAVVYTEQPYELWLRSESRPRPVSLFGRRLLAWRPVPPGPVARAVKLRAMLAYRSQLDAIARPRARLPLRLLVHELTRGGEVLAEASSLPSVPLLS